MKSIIRFLVYSNIFVAFCVLALALSSEVLLGTVNYKISQFVFFTTLFTYNFQRFIRIKKGGNHLVKSWLTKNKIVVYILMICSGLMSLYFFLQFQITTQLMISFIGGLSLLYPFGLRKIPFSKIFIISIVWAISTLLLLALENNIVLSNDIVLHLVSRFLFVFAITIPFDIRDFSYDIEKIKTIPIFFGVKKAKIIAVFSLIICSVFSIFQYTKNALNFENLLALILLYFVSSFLIVKSDRNKGEFYFSFWVESLSILCYLFLVISALIF